MHGVCICELPIVFYDTIQGNYKCMRLTKHKNLCEESEILYYVQNLKCLKRPERFQRNAQSILCASGE